LPLRQIQLHDINQLASLSETRQRAGTADIFSKAWAKRNSHDPRKGSPKTWLWAIARHAVIDEYRKGHPSAVILSVDLAAADRVSEEVDRREEWRRIHTAMGRLPPAEQEIIALRFGAGETNRSIATLLGLTEANVAQRLRRALRKMRGELDNT
jgi:RNA polymerase sigma-70 factor (ECF subfamily)